MRLTLKLRAPPSSSDLHGIVTETLSGIRLANQVTNAAFASKGSTREDPRTLFHSHINSDQPVNPSFVRFSREADGPHDAIGALAHILWTQTQSNASIDILGDILTVAISWEYGAPRELWKIDEKLVLGERSL